MKSANNILTLAGGVIGGIVGCLVYWVCLRQGYSALVAPGAFIGMGAGIFRSKSMTAPIVCGIGGLALGIFTEWKWFPFIADDSVGYFLLHIYQLSLLTLVSIAIGAWIAFWIPFRRREIRISQDG